MRRILPLIILILNVVSGFSQSRTELLHFGDAAFENGQYASAAYYYLRILNKTPDKEKNVTYPYEVKPFVKTATKKSIKDTSEVEPDLGYQYVVHQIAESYRLNHDYNNAEVWYQKSIENKNCQYPNDKFWHAKMIMMQEKYSWAAQEFESFLNISGVDSYLVKRASEHLINCNLVNEPAKYKKDIVVQRVDTIINSGTSNFAMSFYGNKETVIFASGRKSNIISDPKEQIPEYTSDFYVSTRYKDGWGEPRNIQNPVNTDQNEGAGVLSTDKTTFYFTRSDPDNPKKEAIYVSKFFNNMWMQPMKLDESVNLEGFSSKHPSITEDQSRIYYSSNRPGSIGGYDIWYCDINDVGELSLPINMGPVINTKEDEESPFYHYYTKTLYFSSAGHETFGGLDIVRSTYNEDDTIWSTPENLGLPFNSGGDDLFFTLEDKQLMGFFTSDREKCVECEKTQGSDYCYSIYSFSKPKMKFSIEGIVYNAKTEKPISNALITFKDIRGNFEQFFLMTDDKGHYEDKLKEGWDLFIKAQKVKFFGDAAAISTLGLTESKHFVQDFYLTPIPAGEIEIPGIEYDYDKATLRPESKKILDDLVEFLSLNDNIVVEIRSHTDLRGAEDYNMRLSEARAKSVVDYLIAHNIERDRLLPKGYGETQPLIPDAQTEEEHQRNRRTAFKTISQDYIDLYRNNSEK